MKVGSLFSGIGGFDLGLERAGMEVKWQVEIDPFCNKVLAKHWPHVKRYGDIRDVGKHNLEPVDLICGGFPCQPFSSASHGRGLGKDDNRYLWPAMLRVIQELKPTWVIGENVVNLGKMVLSEILSDLESTYYQTQAFIVPACGVGLSHRRNRYWIIGYSDSNSKPRMPFNAKVAVLPERKGNTGGLGVKDGISLKMDRLKSLGNAVVPQIVEILGRAIMEVESQ